MEISEFPTDSPRNRRGRESCNLNSCRASVGTIPYSMRIRIHPRSLSGGSMNLHVNTKTCTVGDTIWLLDQLLPKWHGKRVRPVTTFTMASNFLLSRLPTDAEIFGRIPRKLRLGREFKRHFIPNLLWVLQMKLMINGGVWEEPGCGRMKERIDFPCSVT